jgi:intracellular sulfur oxidation DsrE/DsrF family protein
MRASTVRLLVGFALLVLGMTGLSQRSSAYPPPGKGPNSDMKADMTVFHYLLEHHKAIRRTVKKLDNGVETVTESDNPEVAGKIQEHVASMHKRVKEGRGLRFWDDLFVAIFKNYKKIEMKVENTKNGVRVRETSDDPLTVGLIQAHAEVVSKFVASGFEEAHKNHPVSAPGEAKKSAMVTPLVPNLGGVVPLPKAAEQPRKGAKIVFDITADAKPGEVNKGLERVARLLNLYGAAGLKATDVKLALVLHGEATKSVLLDEAYSERFGAEKNPNREVLRTLKKLGVDVFVCGQALSYKGFAPKEVDGDIPVAAAALTVITNRQSDGYAYVPVN